MSQFNMLSEVADTEAPVNEAAVLNDLLEGLNVPEGADIEEEVVEGQPEEGGIEAALAETEAVAEDLEGVSEAADAIVARQKVYEEQGSDEGAEFTEGDQPTTDPEAVLDAKAQKAAAKAAAAEKRKKEREEARAKKAAEKAAQPPRATKVTHKPGDLLVAKLGSDWRDYVALRTSTAGGDTIALEREQDEFIERMNDRDAIADKVREKAIMLFGFLKFGGELNTVLKRAFTVLHEKGELTSGEKGNLQQNLLAKPYSRGTAAAQANQVFMLFPELAICVKEKGRMVPNPDSALLPVIKGRLGLE